MLILPLICGKNIYNKVLRRVNMALENKLGIDSSPELARQEELISKKKALELFETGYLDTLVASAVL